ncbi:metalloregulator ArsR/SmtB family transcription factor [Endozoicomonas sp.]|nr:metalloregulator ArsR/SmtB family transcription factor [Endozoicomonas sp.]
MAIEQLAIFGKAFGDQLRLNILRLLSTESLGVLELSDVFAMRQPAMSHHLKVLLQAGLVSTRKEGNTIFYRRALPPSDSNHERLVRALFATIDAAPLSDGLSEKLLTLQQRRAKQSQQFFARHADVFRQQQALIADHDLYARSVSDIISQTRFPAMDLAMEIGPGEGGFLKTLSKSFNHVYAVDNSHDMLTCSQQQASNEGLDNVSFLLSEIDSLKELNHSFDCIVANMVLHHVSSPASIFSQAGKLLKPSGSFLISELCRHDQEWVKMACGDLWLGFSPDDLSAWAKQSRFINGDSQYLGLRNGFQIQIRHFIFSK